VLTQATGNSRLIRLTTARTRGKPPPSPILYSLRYSVAPTFEWLLVPGLPRSTETILVGLSGLCEFITLCSDLRLGWSLKQTCSSCSELFNGVSHSICTYRGQVDSWLLVVRSQTANLIPSPSFLPNLCYRCPNGSCEAIFDIYTSITFQWHEERLKARCFDPWNRTLKFWESQRTPKSPFWECECHPHIFQKWGCNSLCIMWGRRTCNHGLSFCAFSHQIKYC
jgi:hypothetical protein